MARNFIQEGHTLTLVAPSGGVESGKGYLIGTLFSIALHDADAGADYEGMTVGVWEINKLAAQAWTQGALVYWDNTNKRCTTVASGNTLIGCAAVAAANPSDTGIVRLNGVARAAEA